MVTERMQENGGWSESSQEDSPAWSSSGEQGYEGDSEKGDEEEVEFEVSLVFRSSVPGVRRAPAIISARILGPHRRSVQWAIEKAIRRGPREVLDAKALILGLEEAIKQGILELRVITHNRALFNHY
ncbi:hypothetical protein HPP92_006482 [Vanilla planifolia]|uniref:Uncharacterized protein n=1 Tax=Vanilla planifolia TaxID=51239 RepID=A0A835REG5_VANPL|nr:hypothetical protein HPP92_006482 [Vanilla planifolia]